MSPIKPNPAKVLLRNEVSSKIAALSAEEKKRQSEVIFNKVISHPWYKSSGRIALYMSTDQEVDTAPLIDHVKVNEPPGVVVRWSTAPFIEYEKNKEDKGDFNLYSQTHTGGLARGAAAFVPQYAGGHMKMLRVLSGDEQSMQLTKHGIAQHSKETVRDDALESGGLDLIIAPGLAFSKSGHRLGHGGGYYDKYLARVRSSSVATKVVALAFNCQVVDAVPVEETDQTIDAVISAE